MRHANQDVQPCLKPDTGHGAGLLLVILLGLALSIAAGLMSSHVMRQSVAPAASPVLAAVRAGTAMDVVVQVASMDKAGLHVRLLRRRGQGYTRTSRVLQVSFGPDMRYVMGGRADLKPGAVLQLKGIAQDAGAIQLQANQAVILTGYVQVSP